MEKSYKRPWRQRNKGWQALEDADGNLLIQNGNNCAKPLNPECEALTKIILHAVNNEYEKDQLIIEQQLEIRRLKERIKEYESNNSRKSLDN